MEWTFTLRNVLAGSVLLGVLGGLLGGYALLRRQSLVGDALAHAALPGVCLAFLITGTRAPFALLAGAMAAGLAGSLLILGVVRGSRVKEDSAIGIVLSVFFGLGIVLLTHIQKLPAGNQSGLDHYLFGQAATLTGRDVRVMAVVGVVVVALVLLFHKEFKLLTFDRAFGAAAGFPMTALDVLLTLMLVVVVVVGLQTVGVVLMVATLVTPAAAARQWTDRFGGMLALSAGLGAASGALGAVASAAVPRLPTGPAIVLLSSLVLLFSLALAPRRGMLWAKLREREVSRRIRRENLLKDLFRIGEDRGDFAVPVPWPVVMGVRGRSGRQLAREARELVRRGFVAGEGDALRLTGEGLVEAGQVVRKHRLWELYLTQKLEIAADHVHRDAEAMEHALTEEAVLELEEKLGFPTVDPHGRAIPPRRLA